MPTTWEKEKTVSAVAPSTAGQQGRLCQTAESVQLVSFRLAEEEYGIEITKVQEIILLGEITRVPRTPDYVKGLINLRSEVIPVVDLRRRFGLPAEEPTEETRIMVINVRGKTLGMIVDAVSEVLRVSQDQVVAPPAAVTASGREYLTGLVQLDNRLLILLDIERVLDDEEAEAAEEAVLYSSCSA
jgi:purine-binding chemotaxis protein CheW